MIHQSTIGERIRINKNGNVEFECFMCIISGQSTNETQRKEDTNGKMTNSSYDLKAFAKMRHFKKFIRER